MRRRPPSSTRTDPRFPYATLFRSLGTVQRDFLVRPYRDRCDLRFRLFQPRRRIESLVHKIGLVRPAIDATDHLLDLVRRARLRLVFVAAHLDRTARDDVETRRPKRAAQTINRAEILGLGRISDQRGRKSGVEGKGG